MENNAEQPAYPVLEFNPQIKSLELSSVGLTKRELVSAMVLQGLCANPKFYEIASGKLNPDDIGEFYSETAIEQADSILSQLQSKP